MKTRRNEVLERLNYLKKCGNVSDVDTCDDMEDLGGGEAIAFYTTICKKCSDKEDYVDHEHFCDDCTENIYNVLSDLEHIDLAFGEEPGTSIRAQNNDCEGIEHECIVYFKK